MILANPPRGRAFVALVTPVLLSTACWHDVLPPTEPSTPTTTPTRDLPASQLYVSGNDYWAPSGKSVSQVHTVFARTWDRQPARNRRVHFTVLSGGGEVSDSVGTTTSVGEVALPVWKFGDADVRQVLRVRVDSLEVLLTGYAFREARATDRGRLLVLRGESIFDIDVSDATISPSVAQLGASFGVASASPFDQLLALTEAKTGALCIARIGDGDAPRCLRSTGLTQFRSFTWSSSGRQLLFTAADAKTCAFYQCWATMFQLDLASFVITPTLPDLDGLSDVRWSPDGTSIVYLRAGALWRTNVDGTSRRVLSTPDSLAITDARWSPSGEQLALTVTFHNSCDWACDTGLAVMSRNGSEFRVLLRANQANNQEISSAVWSSDGTRIAFGMGLVWADDPRQTDTYSVSIADGSVVRLFKQGIPLLWR